MYDVCVYSDLRIIRLWTYYSRWDKTQLPQETIADRARYVCVCVCVCVCVMYDTCVCVCVMYDVWCMMYGV